MECRFLIQKSLRKFSLACGLPHIKEEYIRRKVDCGLPCASLDIDAARGHLISAYGPEVLAKMRERVEGIKEGNLHIFREPPLPRNPGVFLTHPRTGRQERLRPWTRVRVQSAAHREDIKFLWEINRLGDLDSLIALSIVEMRSGCLKTTHELVAQWDRENPFGKGINWFSNMEVALRLLRLLLLQGVMAGFGLGTGTVQRMIAQHAVHVRADWKATRRTMKGGNHLLVELAALAALEALTGIHGLACAELGREAARQFHGDGGYFEGSLGYHLYVLNVLLFVHWLCVMAGTRSPVQEDILKRALVFAEDLTGPDGSTPRIGDWDEGRVFSPGLYLPQEAGAMLSFGKTLLGIEERDRERGRLGIFPQSQMAAWRTRNRDLVVFRAADVEHGHAHLDMLSLHYVGQHGPVILDGGTFQYNHSKEKRDAYRGLSAHSTILPGEDFWPVKPLRAFAWRGRLRVVLEAGDDWVQGEYWVGEGIRVQRKVQFQEGGFTVFDACEGTDTVWSQFIVPRATVDGKRVMVEEDGGQEKLVITPQTGNGAAEIKKRLISDCYGQEREVDAVLFPFQREVVLKVDILG